MPIKTLCWDLYNELIIIVYYYSLLHVFVYSDISAVPLLLQQCPIKTLCWDLYNELIIIVYYYSLLHVFVFSDVSAVPLLL